jgi:hypothetical protein
MWPWPVTVRKVIGSWTSSERRTRDVIVRPFAMRYSRVRATMINSPGA